MNIMQMMKQAQSMQKRAQEVMQELENTEVVGDAADGSVLVTFDGKGKFKSIKIKPEALDPDNPSEIDPEFVEMIEDIVTTAMTRASMKASMLMEEKMKAVTGGISIPGLF